jgi:hypothetical protein
MRQFFPRKRDLIALIWELIERTRVESFRHRAQDYARPINHNFMPFWVSCGCGAEISVGWFQYLYLLLDRLSQTSSSGSDEASILGIRPRPRLPHSQSKSARDENVLAGHAVATLSPIESDDQLLSVLCVSRQAQRSQAAHVFDNSPMASRLLPECIIDLGFASLIALEYALCCDTGFCITHNTSPFVINMGMNSNIIKYLVVALRFALCVTAEPELL